MRAVVLCAGRGTRLGPLTHDRPKALLPVGGRPLLDYVLRWLAREGVADVVVNLHHHGEMIVTELGDGSAQGVSITYVREDRLLGTAGSVQQISATLDPSEDLLVVYGDLLLDVPLQPLVEAHRAWAASATLLVHRRRGSNSVIDIDDDGRVTDFVERPSTPRVDEHWVNSGVAVLGPSARAALPVTVPADLPTDLYIPMVASGRLHAVPLTGARIAIDSPERLAEAEAAVTAGRFAFGDG